MIGGPKRETEKLPTKEEQDKAFEETWRRYEEWKKKELEQYLNIDLIKEAFR